MVTGHDSLAELSRRLGLEALYWSWRGEPVEVSRDTVLAMVAALGHELASPDDAGSLALDLDAAHWREVAPPVAVAWDGEEADLTLRVLADVDGEWEVEAILESGRREVSAGRLFELDATDHTAHGGRVHCMRHARIPLGELGYHRLRWRALGRDGQTLVFAAPTRGYEPQAGQRRWGVLAPLYALRGARSGGAGDLATLGALRALVSRHRGDYVGTLPLLAAFLDQPLEPSPYAPASRLFWNELYLDLDHAPGIDGAPAARALLADPVLAAERDALAQAPRIDYRGQYRWRRRVLDALAEAAWRGRSREMLEAYAGGRALDYALFRALGEAEKAPWSTWPATRRELPAPVTLADCAAAGADLDRVRLHLYAQWAMEHQLAEHEGHGEAGLYLDLPVGVSADAYEVWRDRDLFVLAAATGAPPDQLFLGGQNWGLPPVHPERSRRSGHRYLIECIRHHVRHAAMLRVDHVMGLHRLYCVPAGRTASDGIYLRYPADELYAILTLESHRHRCSLVGEDLGTVPDYVRPAMARHGLRRLHVGQFVMPAAVAEAPARAPAEAVASLNTHDTATFAGWWNGADIDDRRDLGLVSDERASDEHAARAEARAALLIYLEAGDLAPVEGAPEARALRGTLADLAAGPAEVVLVTLEDLWLEPSPQNVPGTSSERPNWRRPMAKTIEEIVADGEVVAALDDVAARRAGPI